jgi:subtilisin family serine protease
MNDERFHIPGDTIVHHERVYAASANVPNLWGHVMLKIHEVHARGITGKGVRIAISDTGVADHPFLPKPIAARSYTGEPVTDRNGHGTHCSGIALGRRGDNGKSLGVAPDAELIIAKVLSNGGSGDTRWINGGRVWAAEQGADVISESLGDNGGPPIPADIQAFEQAYERGALICCAALGNAGFNGRDTVGRPGSYKENLGIAALKEDGKIANFSSGGASADAATPGQNIISCDLRNGFVSMSGTSMATPFMAGVCALVIQWHRMVGRKPPRGWAEWRAYIQTFCDDAGKPGHDHSFGFGVPNLIRLLDSLVPLENV